MENKNELRKATLKKRSLIPENERKEKSRAITERLLSLDLYKSADTVFCYIDMASEVITTDFIKRAWQDGKKVAVPVAKKNRLMYFVNIDSFNGMTRSSLGVMEPDIGIESAVYPSGNYIMIVPGSMFDETKNRCGYGGGYYDTYIEKHGVENTVGVAFDIQVMKSIPVEEFDKKLNMIVTESRLIK